MHAFTVSLLVWCWMLKNYIKRATCESDTRVRHAQRRRDDFTNFRHGIFMQIAALTNYGRPLSVSGRPCYILPMFFYFFLWPPYSPALVNGGSRKFYTWWTLSVIEEVTTWIFSWSSLNYRVGQKVTKFRIFSDPARKLSALTPERGRIL